MFLHYYVPEWDVVLRKENVRSKTEASVVYSRLVDNASYTITVNTNGTISTVDHATTTPGHWILHGTWTFDAWTSGSVVPLPTKINLRVDMIDPQAADALEKKPVPLIRSEMRLLRLGELDLLKK